MHWQLHRITDRLFLNYANDFLYDNEVLLSTPTRAMQLKGYFALNPEILIDFELDSFGVHDEAIITELRCHRFSDCDFHVSNIHGLCLSESKLVVLQKEIDLFIGDSNLVNHGLEDKKTAAKKAEIIPVLLKMIPELKELDIETSSASKIFDVLEAVAIDKGLDFPKISEAAWRKYLGREAKTRLKK